VLRPASVKPTWIATSPAGWFKGKDPSVPIDKLQSAWIPGAEVLYIGKANNLRRRLHTAAMVRRNEVGTARPPRATTRQPRGRATRRTSVPSRVAPGPRRGRTASGRRDATRSSTCKISIAAPVGESVEKQLIENQMFASRQTVGQSPPPESLPIYISWYINGYG